MQKNEVEKYLQRLIMEMKKRKTVKNILIAEDIKAVYYEEKEALSDKLLGLCREVNQYKEEGQYLNIFLALYVRVMLLNFVSFL